MSSHRNERPAPKTSPELSFLPSRSRVYMACVHCRKRRIKCVTTEEYDHPCERCIKKKLHCEYMPVTSGGIPSLSSDSASSSRHGTDPVEPLTPTSLYRPRSTAPPGHPSSPGWGEPPHPYGFGQEGAAPYAHTHAHAVPNISQHHRYSSGVHPSHSRPGPYGEQASYPCVPHGHAHPAAYPYPTDERDAAYPPRLSRNPHHPNIYRSQMESGDAAYFNS
ncbi:hypothetical protein FB45DRAFT_879087 [Roridomyces roridus]|uniref:Zn(2)-C6 fungal-type domain-containing protein n=1 Tax=Roridomyces roridus TaxID=1738132 RepID=A0AAD7AZS5_9AGAR|nr:hypothetical protein FB45DRAFT_879087 [Roridomyces roridus]